LTTAFLYCTVYNKYPRGHS